MSYEKDYMYAIDRSDEYLEHYGIKGMKWGVRKALESGNSRALARQYRKASRKLARLEKRANNGSKYARRAALLGAGAAAAGGLAAAGTEGVGRGLRQAGLLGGRASIGVGQLATRAGNAMARRGIRGAGRVKAFGTAAQRAGMKVSTGIHSGGRAVENWGNKTAFALDNATSRNYAAEAKKLHQYANGLAVGDKGHWDAMRLANDRAAKATASKTKVTNNMLARAGAAAVGAGLAGAAGYNAYRAATTKKAAAKAAQWKKEMNSAFKGTQYANGGSVKPSTKKRRRR